ncbi:MAG: sugar phosphate isomerase/epimerase [Saprospiraceae bacterium]|jgi:sugar phosphate isomerase/epimerase
MKNAMASLSRRNFIQQSSILVAGAALPFPFLNCNSTTSRLFKMSINPGAIGVKLNQSGLLDAAIKYGFESIIAFPKELAEMNTGLLNDFIKKMKSKNISWGSAGLPLDFRKSAAIFDQGMKDLPVLSKALQQAGVSRMNTWIMPTNDTLTYRENFKQHAERLGAVAKVIADYGIDLGLEYVGPKTLMARDRYSFIRSMKETKELIAETKAPNLKIQLDSFHWFCAEETVEDILSLDKNDIVTVDLNDATKGRTAAEQIDGQRELPGDSGVIDLKAFLGALIKIGYDGPVRAEPFNKPLNEMDNEAALAATYKAMKSSFDLVK